jgi:hypothetical protein
VTLGRVLTAIGLIANMAGAFVLWLYLPAHSVAVREEDTTTKKPVTTMKPVGRIAKVAQPLGWCCLALGFLLQLLGLVV